jgi:hypothetical protein
LADDETSVEPDSSEEVAADELDAAEGIDEEMASTLEAMMESLRQAKVSELLLSTATTLASVAYGKLELGDLAEAKLAIDAIGATLALLRDHTDAALLRDFEQALAGLQLAYAQATTAKP